MPTAKQVAITTSAAVILCAVFLISGISNTGDGAQAPGDGNRSVFARRRLYQEASVLIKQTTAAFAKENYALAESLALRSAALVPDVSGIQYNLACAQARLGKTEAALQSLQKAIDLGFRGAKHMKQDDDLFSLHTKDAWPELLKQASAPAPAPSQVTVKPALIQNRIARTGEENTFWDPAVRRFRVFFRAGPESGTTSAPVIDGSDEVATLLNSWHREGTAAGLTSVLYDNRDRDHSNIDLKRFPQLSHIEYSEAAASEKLDNGLQYQFHFNAVTLGNSSTALVGSPAWRSQPRLAYVDSGAAATLASQYFGNHLYVYPEHQDYDPGRNGRGGYGDVFSANTPCVIISQGSSLSDKPFLNAVASALAAFRPDVRKTLQQNGVVFPCIQMILRRCLTSVKSDADYLSGIAHPPVFDGNQLNVPRMVKMAHEMEADCLPPVAMIRVVAEDQPVNGRDFFDVHSGEALFTTPAAIARVCRSVQQVRRITIDASGSRDLSRRDLSWHWVVLQGDPQRIDIRTQNDQQSVAAISVKHHERRPIRPGSKMESSRVDIGVFVHNGKYYSPPAIVSFYWPENEERVYDEKGRILSVRYSDHASGGNYADPLIVTAKNWKDEYTWSNTGQLTGWTRIRQNSRQRFTTDGALVDAVDDLNRPLRARTVRYVASPRPGHAPILKQLPGDRLLEYAYESETDEVGRAREKQEQPDSR